MENNLRQELTDPVTLELFVDPVTVPCCGKSFSRETLESLQEQTCPNCRSSLDHFDTANAPKNVLLASLVESLLGVPQPSTTAQHSQSHAWSCSLTPIQEKESNKIFELVLTCDRTDFKTRPSLFIAVVDESGSMEGRPMDQVRMALNHMVELAKVNTHVILKMIAYSSGANEIVHVSEYGTRVGGTNFRAAFGAVTSLLRQYKSSDNPSEVYQENNVSSVAVAFLTDGMDGSRGGRDRLVPELKESLEHAGWGEGVDAPPVVVHTVGFGQSCDRQLLESIRQAGNQEGFFRYADPTEDADALCNKLTDLFEFSSRASSVPVQIQCEALKLQRSEIRFAVDARRCGQYKTWIQGPPTITTSAKQDLKITVNSALDNDVSVPLLLKAPTQTVFQRWLAKCTDKTAKTVFETVSGNAKDMTDRVSEFFCAILELQVRGILRQSTGDNLSDRASFLLDQINALRSGTKVQLSKLSDLRFASNFSGDKHSAGNTRRQTVEIRTLPPPTTLALDDKPAFERPLRRRYNRNNNGMGRNEIQEAIMDSQGDAMSMSLAAMIGDSSPDDIMKTDRDGNNALMLAAYCGHATILEAILSMHGELLDLETQNPEGETALTLSIKKRGFHRTLVSLIDAGAHVPRAKALERFCIDHGFSLTAQVLTRVGETSLEVDDSMTPEYIQFMYERAKKSPEDAWDKNKYLGVAVSKQMKSVAIELLRNGAQPTIEMLLECVPKTADHPEEAKYLELAKLLLEDSSQLIHEKTQPDGETALFVAASRGSRSHVQYFFSLDSDIEAQNAKGNTPLWIASFKRYPCIMEFLIEKGANLHHCNMKGNPVIYGPCCRGPPKIAEQLIQSGACVDKVFETGETTILMCCRNGTAAVLNLLLDYVDEDFVNHKAPIDGFNALMASAEQNHDDCIRLLDNFGIDLDQVTDDENQILARASPLHIAAYYNRAKAAKVLLELGANPNIQDLHGSTPMHLAVIQGSEQMIEILRDYADLTVEDDVGNTPIAYCRSNEKIQKLLVSPIVGPLLRLSKGGYTAEEEKAVLGILKECGIPGVLSPENALAVRDNNGTSVLSHAVMYGRREVVELLLSLGVSANTVDASDMSVLTWAHWTKNARVKKLLKLHGAQETDTFKRQITNLASEASADSSAAALLFPSQPLPCTFETASTITRRMELFVNAPCSTSFLQEPFSRDLPKLQTSSKRVDKHFDDDDLSGIDPHLLWLSKLHTVRHIANGSPLGAAELMAVGMLTNNDIVADVLNSQLLQRHFSSCAIKDYASVLHGALEKLTTHQGEVFLAAKDTDRRLFSKGTEFTWNRFVSASTLWRVALENVPSFTSNARRGVIFLIKSLTGRLIGQFSQHSFDSEVIFLPNTRFRVTNWYHGDPIALGQENIREYSYGIKENDAERLNIQEMMEGDKRLIIELTEIQEC